MLLNAKNDTQNQGDDELIDLSAGKRLGTPDFDDAGQESIEISVLEALVYMMALTGRPSGYTGANFFS